MSSVGKGEKMIIYYLNVWGRRGFMRLHPDERERVREDEINIVSSALINLY